MLQYLYEVIYEPVRYSILKKKNGPQNSLHVENLIRNKQNKNRGVKEEAHSLVLFPRRILYSKVNCADGYTIQTSAQIRTINPPSLKPRTCRSHLKI